MAPKTAARRVEGNLPADCEEIVGRRQDAADIRRLLASTRLLTLTGPGGVGKTRLALHVAAKMRRAFSNGVWLVHLASLQDAKLLDRAVAEALGVHDKASRSSLETLIDHVRDKQTLIVLDNCEHLIDACAAFAEQLLRAVPEVRLLATSREVLGLPAEVRYVVPPLSLPPQDQRLTSEGAGRYEAVTLFLERAKAIDPGFGQGVDYGEVARLCRLVDGIPLAIELAAVQLRVLSLHQITDRLGDHLNALTPGYRTTAPRHQTLRAAVAWSFELCSPAEQMLWQRVTVFSGGFDLNAAEEVCSGNGLAREELLPLLAALIDKSVLTHDNAGPRARYGMLELLRQYGAERLAASEPQTDLQHRHLDHYRRLAERIRASWFTPSQVDLYADVVREMPNFRVALDHALADPARTEMGLQIITRLYGYWVYSGGFSEARYWLDRAVRLMRDTYPARFRALATQALFALMQWEIDAARPLIRECSALADGRRDPGDQAMVQFLSGRLAMLLGDYDDAISRLEESVKWYENAGAAVEDDVLQGPFLCVFYLTLAAAFGRDPRAAAFAARCRRTAEIAGAQGEISWGVWVNGIERWLAGEREQAVELFRASIRIGGPIGYRYGAAGAIESLAWATAADGRDVRAARLLGAAASIRRILGLSLPGFRSYAGEHEEWEATLRSRMGEAGFATAFEQGAGLDFDEAVAYALEEPAQPSEAGGDEATRPRAETAELTPRELEVAGLIARGVRNKEIAARLVISPRTAEGHVEHILSKLGFTSRTQIAAWYFDNVTPPQEY
ncbi:LuxR family transcriptional regulator [Nonomuraea deserti]|uniref:LuxR family transcriptional regulator n=1 Tax=Nonomuraea deserti TaxID=1848322 RepID=A0A4R4UZ86_9ACTN|nr:LuxR C-terminal-related transcriptional regulator [Nonomuraea deserti]TDC98007.1 LuxR family transcriptional regulator [Nonomuraea deserti]